MVRGDPWPHLFLCFERYAADSDLRASAFLENVILYLNLNEENVGESKLIVDGNNDKCIRKAVNIKEPQKLKGLFC